MESGEKASPNPPGNIFNPTSLIDYAALGTEASATAAYAHLAHVSGAFPLHPFFSAPLPFGGLGSLADGLGPLRSPSHAHGSPSHSTNGSLASVLFPAPITSTSTQPSSDGLQPKSTSSLLKAKTKLPPDDLKESSSTASSDDEKIRHLSKNGVHSMPLDGSTDSSLASFPATGSTNPFYLPLPNSSVSPMAYFPFGNSPLVGLGTVHNNMFNHSPLFTSPMQSMFPYGSTATVNDSSSPDRPVTTRHGETNEKRRKTSHGRGSSTNTTTATSVAITGPILAVPKPAVLTPAEKKQRCTPDQKSAESAATDTDCSDASSDSSLTDSGSLHSHVTDKVMAKIPRPSSPKRTEDPYPKSTVTCDTFWPQEEVMDLSMKKPATASKPKTDSVQGLSSSLTASLTAPPPEMMLMFPQEFHQQAAALRDLSFGLGAGLIPPMFDSGMFIPPPPGFPASSPVKTRGRGRRGRGRLRGRGATVTGAVEKGVAMGGVRRGGRGRGGRGSRSRAAEMMKTLTEKYLQEKNHSQVDENARLEAELKQKQLKLKLYRSLQQAKNRQQLLSSPSMMTSATDTVTTSVTNTETRDSPKGKSKLAEVLMGQSSGLATSSARTAGSTHASGLLEGEKPIVDHSSDTDSDGDSEDDSSLDADSDSSTDTDDASEGHAMDTSSPQGANCSSPGHDESMRKRRRRTILDETEIKIPLEYGWRRETRIRSVGTRGIMGEVMYHAPCGKKLRSYQEVDRYLDRNGITDLSRDNFTFSTKVCVGEFYETVLANGPQGHTYRLLSDSDVQAHYAVIEARKNKILERKQRAEKRIQQKRLAADIAMNMSQGRLERRMQQQELARKVAEIKLWKKWERQRQKESARQTKEVRLQEVKKQREQQRLMRHQEKVNRQHQVRVEREMKTRQVIEEREMKRQHFVHLKDQPADESSAMALVAPPIILDHPSLPLPPLLTLAPPVGNAASSNLYFSYLMASAQQEHERRRQMAAMMGLEKERRRQHILLVKALEARKKQQERERLKEEKKEEKIINRQRKIEQKQMELLISCELKKPVEDMRLRDSKELPELHPLPGVRVSGCAFASCLMVVEFMHNFGTALGFDTNNMPTVASLQSGLLNDEQHMNGVSCLLNHLLTFALDDPGVPCPKEAVTASRMKLADININAGNISEVLRIFIRCRSGHHGDEMSPWLSELPFQALTPTQKGSILEFLCNELLCSHRLTGEIDKNIESINNLRRDKWIIEGKLRKLRMIRAKRFRREATSKAHTATVTESPVTGDDGLAMSKHCSDDEDNDSANESDAASTPGNMSEAEDDDVMTSEELGKQMDKLSHQLTDLRKKVFDTSHKLRASSFGQDRYQRRYWALPTCGGIYLESRESAELPDDKNDIAGTNIAEQKHVVKSENELAPYTKVDDNVRVKAEHTIGSTHDMEIGQESGTSVTRTLFGCEQDSKQDKKTFSIEGIISAMHRSRDAAVSSVGAVKTERPSVQNTSVGNSSTCRGDNSLIASPPSSSSLFLHQAPPPLASESCDRRAHSSCNGAATFRSISSILSTPDSSLPTDMSMMSPSFSASPHTLAASTPISLSAYDVEPGSWFSVLPRTSCDPTQKSPAGGTTSAVPSYLKSSTHTALNDPSLSTFHLRQSSHDSFSSIHNATAGSDVNASVLGCVTGDVISDASQIAAQVEAMLVRDQVQYVDSKPIPENCCRGWWKTTDIELIRSLSRCLHPRGIRERNLQKSLQKHVDYVGQTCSRSSKAVSELDTTVEGEREEEGGTEGKGHLRRMGAAITEVKDALVAEVDNMEERVCGASLQVKSWKKPSEITPDTALAAILSVAMETTQDDTKVKDAVSTKQHELEFIKKRLLALEKNIERRYFQPPFAKSIKLNLLNISVGSGKDGDDSEGRSEGRVMPDSTVDAPKELLSWRQAVLTAHTSSQLSLLLSQLNSCIAWEKSVMKVCCQICCQDDNEAELLLCDCCDKGYHTYCFRPKLENIPDGDWYCYECISKATGDSCCFVCGGQGFKLAECEHCLRAIHLDCMDPPLSRMPRKWCCAACAACARLKGNSTSKKKRKSVSTKSDSSRSTPGKTVESTATSSPRPTEKIVTTSNKKDNKAAEEEKVEMKADQDEVEKKAADEDSDMMTPCRQLLSELEQHECAWPFKNPVNGRRFPTYHRVILHPMDLHTVRGRLDTGRYKTRDEFFSDVSLICSNCDLFNEDDSPVGEAGHALRTFFEQRMFELCGAGPVTKGGSDHDSAS